MAKSLDPEQYDFMISDTIKMNMYAMVGFDNETFSKSISEIEFGTFPYPSPSPDRPKILPFPGFSRWTAVTHIAKLGFLLTFPILRPSTQQDASLHVSVEPSTLWKYADLYNDELLKESRNPDFYLMNSVVGPKTREKMNDLDISKTENALQNLRPIEINISLMSNSSSTLLRNLKLAWLNMTENTWIVLCNTSVRFKNPQTLEAIAYINASIFFGYSRNKGTFYSQGSTWKDAVKAGNQNYVPVGFMLDNDDLISSDPISCPVCDPQLQGGGPCDGCGARFELFSFAGCYHAPAVSDVYPATWDTSTLGSIQFTQRAVLGCDYRILPSGVPNQDTANGTSDIGWIVLSPGFGWKAFIAESTFSITAGVGLCVIPSQKPVLNQYIPDLLLLPANLGSINLKLYSDIARLYLDAAPTLPIIISLHLKYFPTDIPIESALNYAAVSWYNVRLNEFFPWCLPSPPSGDGMVQLELDLEVLNNPDFSNGPLGCQDVELTTSRRQRCDGFGARIVAVSTDVCGSYNPFPCTSLGICFPLSQSIVADSVQISVENVNISLTAGTLVDRNATVSIWIDNFTAVVSDTFYPLINGYWDQSFTGGKKVLATTGMYSIGIIRVLFSENLRGSVSVNGPVTVSVNLGSALGFPQSLLTKLAFFNRTALSWFPLCSSEAHMNGSITGHVDYDLLRSADFGLWKDYQCEAGQPLKPPPYMCQYSGMLAVVLTTPSICGVEIPGW